MKKIIIHNPGNEHTKNHRFYNYFFDQFTEHLKKNFEVEEDNYFEFAHAIRYPIKLQKGTNNDNMLLECEYLIENYENGEFVVMSVSDCISGIIFNEKYNPYLKKVLVSQFLVDEVYLHSGRYMYKYSPWTYFQSDMTDLEVYYTKRLNHPSMFLNDKLFFRGIVTDRSILQYFNKNIITSFEAVSPISYFNDLISHKIALSVDGVAEFCYRDIECFAVGVPILRFEYLSKMYNELIPDYHYISIPRPHDLGKLYRLGNESHARLIEKRYFEVINDVDFLNFISNNARKYYADNCQLNSIIKNTHNLLNLNNWI